MRKGRVFRGAFARVLLLAAAGLLSSVSGVTDNYETTGRPVVFSDWRAAGVDVEATERVGSFTVGKPQSERFVGGLFEEWRDLILPEFGRVDPLVRQRVRDKLFFNRDGVDFHEYLRTRREDLLLRFNRVSADYLTGTLTRGVETGAGGLSFVRNVEVDYQSSLGKRRWQSGVNVLGALRETADDAIVWQLRGYAAKESSAGANVGLIYRRGVNLNEKTLMGANVFFDYESHDYGDFLRWSYGGEVRGGWGGLFVNRYLAISDAEELSDGGKAYTQDGLDAAAEFTVPRLRWISGGLTYYKWDGEFGQADDKGFRYHGAFDFSQLFGGGDFWGGLSFLVEYDSPHKADANWGWKLAYRHRFDAATPTGSSTAAESFDPREHFFDPVRREYAQRIKVKKGGGGTTPDGTPILDVVATVVAGTASFAFDAGGTVAAGAPIVLTAGGSVVAYRSTAMVSVRTEADSTVNIVASPRWTVGVFEESRVRFSDEGRRLHLSQGTVHVRRNGVLREITTPGVTVSLVGTNLTVGYPREVTEVRVAGTVTTTVTTTVSFVDVSEGVLSIPISTGVRIADVVALSVSTDEATVVLQSTVTVRGTVRFSAPSVTVQAPFGGRTVSIRALTAAGGYAGSYDYAVASPTAGYSFAGSVLSATGSITALSTLTVQVSDGYSRPASAVIILTTVPPITSAPLPLVTVRADAAVGTPLLTITTAGGGYGSLTYRVRSGDGVRMEGNVAVLATASEEMRRTVTVAITDATENNELLLPLTVRFLQGLAVAAFGSPVVVEPDLVAGDAVLTLSVSGGTPPYRYMMFTDTDLAVDSSGVVSLGSDGVEGTTREGMVRITDAANSDVLSVTVRVQFRVTTVAPNPRPVAAGTLYVREDASVLPTVVATLTAVGGTPPYAWREVADAMGVLTVGADGVVTVTALPASGLTVTASVAVADSTLSGTAAITVVFYRSVRASFSPGTLTVLSTREGALAAVRVSEGRGVFDFSVASNPASLTATVDVSGTVGLVSPLNELEEATLEVVVTDRLDGGRATAALVLVRSSVVAPLELTPAAVRYELTPDYTGAVHHLRPLGGAGGYTFSLARGTTALTVDAAGVVSLTTPLAVGLEVAEFSVTDSAGTVVAFTLSLRVVAATPADYPEDLFLIAGGGDSSYEDVWRSGNGLDWRQVTSDGGFGHRNFYQAVSHGGSLWVIGGKDGNHSNDVWASLDGVSWREVTASAGFLPRRLHQAVSYRGSLWVIGGDVDDGGSTGDAGDVWHSANGRDWTQVTGVTGFGARESHQVVSFAGSLWIIGGNRSDYPSNDVWRSADGMVWTEVIGGNRFLGRQSHQVVAHGGHLWVIAGSGTQGFAAVNDVWRSADGREWELVTVSAAFAVRWFSQAVSYGGSLWVISGQEGFAGEQFGATHPDVWRSGNGADWVLVTGSTPFGARAGHQVVLHRVVRPFVREPLGVVPVLPGTQAVAVRDGRGAVPLTLVTLAARGIGTVRFAEVADSDGVATVAADGAFVVTAVLAAGEKATVSVRVSDAESMPAVVAVTISFVPRLSLALTDARYDLSPDYVGALHTMTAGGGFGEKVYSRVSGTPAVEVSEDGVVSKVVDLTAGRYEAVFAVTDDIGMARFSLNLRVLEPTAEDVSGAMYLVGGNLDNGYDNMTTRADVWRSTDGEVWTEVAADAGFPTRQNHQLVLHRGSLWVIGGENEENFSTNLGDVWVSGDGTDWQEVTLAGDSFGRRYNHQAVSYGGSLWVMGGNRLSPINGDGADVWRSADGASWVLVAASASFEGNRRSYQLVSHEGSLWVIGGSNQNAGVQNDIWRSADGQNWDFVVSATAGFDDRGGHQAVSQGGTLWVMGGVNDNGADFSDVWWSTNGSDWMQSGSFGPGRSRHQMVYHKGSLWVIGGSGGGGETPVRNDVWSSPDGMTWNLVTATATFPARRNHRVVVLRVLPPPFVRESQEVVAVATETRRVPALRGTPLSLTILLAKGGMGGALEFSEVGDAPGVTVRMDGVLVVTDFPAAGSRATVSVLANDPMAATPSPESQATAVVTLAFVAQATLAAGAASYELSPDYAGVVLTLTAGGGVGSYRFSRVSGATALVVSEEGVVSLVSPLALGRHSAVFLLEDEIGSLVRFTLNLRVVAAAAEDYEEVMYLIAGGGDSSHRDVWRSENGLDWRQVTSDGGFDHRSVYQAVSHGGSLWVIGGRAANTSGDVWASADGVSWREVTASAGFLPRRTHQAVSYRGSLWVIAGEVDDGGNLGDARDVWHSANGRDWTQVTGVTDFGVRESHQVVSFAGSLWIIGGSKSGSQSNDVWRSADGMVWTEVTGGNRFPARQHHQAVAYGGSLWVIAGSNVGGEVAENDVWRSADGQGWELVTASAAFAARVFHQAVSYGGSLWVISGREGYDLSANPPPQFGNTHPDVWRSGNGADWVLVTGSAPFGGRAGHQVAVLPPAPFIRVPAGIRATGPGAFGVYVDGQTPVTLGTLEVAGALGAPSFGLTDDARNVATVRMDGALVVTNLLATGERATVTVTVGDSGSAYGTTMAVTMAFVEPLSLATESAWYEVSPDYAGAVHSLSVGGGFGDVSFSLAMTPLAVDAAGGVALTAPLAAGRRVTATIVARDAVSSVRFVLSLQVARAGRLVDYVYLVGGRESGGDYQADVWRSADGRRWERLTADAGFAGRVRHEAVFHDGSLWVMGGYDGNARLADVWRSADGRQWHLVTVSAAFGGRDSHQVVSYNGSLALVAGETPRPRRRSDVWASADGAVWTRLTGVAAFPGSRVDHQVVVYGGSLWVMGGTNFDYDEYYQDVWRSSDGAAWELAATAAFSGRRGHEAFSDGDNLWVVAGVTVDSSGDDVGYDDTWQSPDGGTWVLYDSGAVFGARLGHQAFWFDGRPWVVGGFDPADGSSGADNGIWHEDDSGSWVAVTPSGEVFSARSGHRVAVGPAVGPYIRDDAPVEPVAAGLLTVSIAAVPLTAAVLTADGGRGGLVWTLVADAAGVMAVATDGALVATATLRSGSFATVSVAVADAAMLSRATMAVTMFFFAPLAFSPSSANYSVAPNFAGVAHHLRPTGGIGDYSFSLVAGDVNFELGDAGVVLVTGTLAASESATAVFEVRDEAGEVARFSLSVGAVASADGFGEAMFVVGGSQFSGGNITNRGDVWRSTDGREWTRVASSAFPARHDHEVVVHDGHLWVIGGDGDVLRNDVWRSADAVNWDRITVSAGFLPRGGHGAFSYGGLWVIGGLGSDSALNDVWSSPDEKRWVSLAVSGGQFSERFDHGVALHRGSLWVIGGNAGGVQDDVWASFSGQQWELVTADANFDGRQDHEVVAHGGTLWVMGGSDGVGHLSDIWYSVGGTVWTEMTVGTKFEGRHSFGAVSFGGDLWVSGGAEDLGYHDDVWRSGDGDSWTLVVDGAPFGFRYGHRMVAFAPSIIEQAEIVPPMVGTLTVGVTAAAPVVLMTLRATGGAGGGSQLWYEATDSSGSAEVDRETGVLRVRSLLRSGEFATVSVVIGDLTPINRATMVVTIYHYSPLTIGRSAARYAVNPDFSGVVHDLGVVGGSQRDLVYSRVAGPAAVTAVAAGDSGVVSLVARLAAGSGVAAVFEVRDALHGEAFRFSLSLAVAGSSQDFTTEGIYTFGGYDGDGGIGEVYFSEDGERWKVVRNPAAFGGRGAHQVVEHDGALWLSGGDLPVGNNNIILNDVWRSTDAVNWRLVTANAAFARREEHQMVSYRGSLWVIGGSVGGSRFDDVWVSGNGSDWMLVTAGAFAARAGHRAFSYNGSLVVMGGRTGGGTGASDYGRGVWTTADGANWRRAGQLPLERSNHQVIEHGGSLWLIGGTDGQAGDAQNNDVWRSADGTSWQLVTATAAFRFREKHQAFSYRNSLWVMGGTNDEGAEFQDVWRSAEGTVWMEATSHAVVDRETRVGISEFQALVYRPRWSVYALSDIVLSLSIPGLITVAVDREKDSVALATLYREGGVGALRYEFFDDSGALELDDEANPDTNDGLPRVWILRVEERLKSGTYSTISMVVSDETLVNRATAVVTVRHFTPLSIPETAKRYAVSPGFTGELHVIEGSGGVLDLRYERVAGATALTVNVSTGVVSLTATMATGMGTMAVFAVRDSADVSVLFTLSLDVEGISGDFAEGVMYVVGGVGGGDAFRDVWRSTDGETWERLVATAAFGPTHRHGLAVYRGSLWVIGRAYVSQYGATIPEADVWRSADGISWELVTATAAFGARSDHQVAVHDGSLWVIGGQSSSWQDDVWRSADGENWVLVTTRAAALRDSSGVREDFRVVTWRGSLWIMGGHNRGAKGDVWRSADGASWTRVVARGFDSRHSHAMAVHDGSLWIVGGYPGGDSDNHVWGSGDGVSWQLITRDAPFAPRQNHQLVSYGGSLWVIAGSPRPSSFGYGGDVWRSADGVEWTEVVSLRVADGNPQGIERTHHQVAVFAPSRFVYEVSDIAVAGPTGTVTATIGASLPVTVAMITATGARGGAQFELVDDFGAFRVGADGALVVTAFREARELVTVTVQVRDSTPGSSVETAVSVFFFKVLAFSAPAAEYVVAGGYTGSVHALSVSGGIGSYRFSRESGNAALTVDAMGVVSLATGLPAGRTEMAVFAVRDSAGGVARFTLTVRTATAGEYAEEAMYVIAGYTGERAVNKSDVWRSTDGVDWELLNADAFLERVDHRAVSYRGSLWVIGGSDSGFRYLNDVWRSADGRRWTLVTATAAFSARARHEVAVYRGSLMVIGGSDSSGLVTDVWASANGSDWDLVTVSAGFSARENHQAVVYGGSLWVAAGSAGSAWSNEVWRSADGKVWTKAADGGFDERKTQMVTLGGSLWVAAGNAGSDFRSYRGDVWRSDGSSWYLVTGTAAFGKREVHRMAAYRGSLWVVGGYGDDGNRKSDVWVSGNGADWRLVRASAAFESRSSHGLVVFAPDFSIAEMAEIVGATMAVAVTVGVSMTLTRAASGGVGALNYRVVADAQGVAKGGSGGPVMTNFLNAGERATITVAVSDSTAVNRATIAVTMVFVAPLSVVAPEFVFSPSYVGVLGTLRATGGGGGYRYEYAGTVRGLEVGAETGAISVGVTIQTLPTEQPVFVVQDGGGGRVEVTVSLRHRGEGKMAAYLTGGGNGSGKFNDVWIFDTDVGLGNEFWRLTLANAAFSARDDHQMVFHDNYLWVIGGESGRGLENDIWRSVDGVEWLRMFPEGDVFSAREGHQAVSHGGHLFVIGGGAGDARYNDVWRSTDGTRWTRVVANADFSGRKEHQVVSHGGHLILSGGEEELSGTVRVRKNDVWRSADGVSWTLVVANAQFSARTEHQMVARGGSLWVLGGEGGMGRFLDIWASTDGGASWTKLPNVRGGDGPSHESFFHLGKLWSFGGRGSNSFSNGIYDFGSNGKNSQGNSDGQNDIPGRSGHQVAVAVDLPSAYQSTPIDLISPTVVPTVNVTTGLPQALFTVTASGGSGGRLRYGLAGGEDIMRVDENGVVWLVSTASNGENQSLTVRVWAIDSTPAGYAEASVTVFYIAPLSTPESGLRYAVPPGRTGEMFTVTVRGGSGSYAYRQVAGTAALFFELNKVFLTKALDAGSRHETVFEVRNQAGGDDSFRVTLSLLVADSETDPRYAEGTLFLSGGNKAGVATYGDIWSSRDGRVWDRRIQGTNTGAWTGGTTNLKGYHPRAFHQMVAQNGSLFIHGGLHNNLSPQKRGEVWASDNGEDWRVVWTHEQNTLFHGRDEHQMVSHKGSLWVFGGIGKTGVGYLNDKWRSVDGRTWIKVTPLARHRLPLIGYHQVASHNGTLFLMGGLVNGDTAGTPDIWYSTSGARWFKFAGATPPLRNMSQYRHLISHRGSLYLVAHSQVWRSADGKAWEQITPGGGDAHAGYVGDSWPNKWRQGYSAFSFAGSLWVVGGFRTTSAGTRNYLNDVWRSEDGVTWTRVTGGRRFEERAHHQITPLYSPTGWFSRRADEDGIPLD